MCRQNISDNLNIPFKRHRQIENLITLSARLVPFDQANSILCLQEDHLKFLGLSRCKKNNNLKIQDP